MLQDKYGDYYFLLDNGGLEKPFAKYKMIAGLGMDIVVVGKPSLMDPSIITNLKPSMKYVPFRATKIFNADLSSVNLNAK
jgi:hypothetical protein